MSESATGTARTGKSRAKVVSLLGPQIELAVALDAVAKASDAAERAIQDAEAEASARRDEFTDLYEKCLAHGWTPEQLAQGGWGPERSGRSARSRTRRGTARGRREATAASIGPDAGAPPTAARRDSDAPAPAASPATKAATS